MTNNLPAVAETEAPSRGMPPDVMAIVRGVGLGSEAGMDVLAVPLTHDQRNTIGRRRNELESMLRPISYAAASQGRAAAAVSRMMQGFRNLKFDSADHLQKMTSSYVGAMNDIPLFAIEEACQAFGAGLVTRYYIGGGNWGTHDPAFCPSEAVLTHVARGKAMPMNDEFAKLKKILGARTALPSLASDRSEADQARVEANISEWRKEREKRAAEEEVQRLAASKDAADKAAEFNRQKILAEYKAQGLKPVYSKTGVLISMSLLKTMGHTLIKSDDEFHAERDDSEARVP